MGQCFMSSRGLARPTQIEEEVGLILFLFGGEFDLNSGNRGCARLGGEVALSLSQGG